MARDQLCFLRNIPVHTLYFGLATWVQPPHSAPPRPSSVPEGNLMLAHGLLSSLPLSAAVLQCDAMSVGTNDRACGFNWPCTANDIGYAVRWSQHVWTPYRLLTSMVWVHPGREATRAGRGKVSENTPSRSRLSRYGLRWFNELF